MSKKHIFILSAALFLLVGSALAQDVAGEMQMSLGNRGPQEWTAKKK